MAATVLILARQRNLFSAIILSGIYIVLREGTPSVSQNRPVLENRSRWEIGTLPRISSWLKRSERGGDQA